MRDQSSAAFIFRRNVWVFGVFQTVIGLALLHSAITRGPYLITLACAAICIPPIFVWVTYRECRRAWRDEQIDEVSDVSLPALTIMGIVLGARLCLYGLLGS